jgi:hypothetical protein
VTFLNVGPFSDIFRTKFFHVEEHADSESFFCTVGNDQLRWAFNQSRDGEMEKTLQENGFIREECEHRNRM